MVGPLLVIIIGLGAAASWGAGDFYGGLATRRVSAITVLVISQLVGITLLLGLVAATGEPLTTTSDLALGALAGLLGSLGLLALYRGLATGQMGIVAPLAAVLTAAIPVTLGIIVQGWPTSNQLAGFALALPAIWFLSRNPSTGRIAPRDLLLPLGAGLGFGLFLFIIGLVSESALLWPLVLARAASILFFTLVASFRRTSLKPPRALWGVIILAGIFEVGGNILFALAASLGRLDVAATLSALYPASTVLLAALVLDERLNRSQGVGVALALTAVVLIAL